MTTRLALHVLLVGTIAGGLGRAAAQECNLFTQLLPLLSQFDQACATTVTLLATNGGE